MPVEKWTSLLEIFRIRCAGRPLLLAIAVLLLLLVLRRVRRSTADAVWIRHASRLTAVAGFLALAFYPAVALWYASSPHFFDNAEPTMPAVGWLFHAGLPIYHSVGSASRYAHIYGPMVFIVQGAVLAAFGPSIEVSKAVGATAGIASLAMVYPAVRGHASAARAAVLTGFCALLLLLFRNYSFWTRPDPLQVLAESAALLFAVRGRGYTSVALAGLASGVMWNLKFTGPLYSLPVLALVHSRSGWRGTALAIAAGAAVAVAPFALLPNVSLMNYVSWVRLSAHTGLLLSLLRQNLEWALFLAVPLLLSYYAAARDARPHGPAWRNAMVTLFFAILCVVIAAAKPGAGPYHLMPFLPVITYMVGWQLSSVSAARPCAPVLARVVVAFVATVLAIALAQQAQLVTTLRAERSVMDVRDLEEFTATHAGVVQMGYGQTEALTLARPVLVFRSGMYLLDQPAVGEHQLAGVEIPRATSDALAACLVDYWLIPKGERPFTGVNGYAAAFLRPLYPADFRRVFDATYTRVGVTRYYDVWQCQKRMGT